MMIRRFVASERGNFAMMFGVSLPVMLAAVGLALDVSTLTNARAKLQASLDAALLASAHLKDPNQSRQEVFDTFLATNLYGETEFSNVKSDLDVDNGLNYIEAQGKVTADVTLHLMQYFGTSTRITVTSGAYEATNTLEVAMVLDNTGSMGVDRMKALREAAAALADILEGAKSSNREVKAALVPFVTSVNVKGTGYNEDWIDKDGEATYHGANFDKHADGKPHNHLELFEKLGVTWKGCVEARPAPYNLDDTAPDSSKPDTLFVPYFAPDNPGAAAKSPNDGAIWNNSYLADLNKADPVNASNPALQRTIARYLDPATVRYIDEKGPRSTGPNYACPTPIVPLTEDFDALRTAISQMIHWEGSGTNVSEGLAWGMRVLSPGEPYTQGHAFKVDGVSKVVVVFTDGENTVFGASNGSLSSADAKHLPFNKSDYGSYSFLDSNRMGTLNRGSALTNVNTWTQTMCTTLKDQGVQIFTVLLGADTDANRKLYSKCASKAENYFPTKDVSQLKNAFEKIGTAVAQLYLTH